MTDCLGKLPNVNYAEATQAAAEQATKSAFAGGELSAARATFLRNTVSVDLLGVLCKQFFSRLFQAALVQHVASLLACCRKHV
jgi:hypothetical protein